MIDTVRTMLIHDDLLYSGGGNGAHAAAGYIGSKQGYCGCPTQSASFACIHDADYLMFNFQVYRTSFN